MIQNRLQLQSSNQHDRYQQFSFQEQDNRSGTSLKTQISVDRYNPKQVDAYHEQWNAKQHWIFDEVIDRNFGNQKLLVSVEPFLRLLATQKQKALCSTIIAYGQTCSGKTYSLFGSQTVTGLFQYSIRYFLDNQSQNSDHNNNRRIKLKIQMCQIYLDCVYDLLAQNKSNNNKKLEIDYKQMLKSGQKLENGKFLESCELSDYEYAKKVIDRGMKQRQVGANNVHEHSSRSHLIVKLKLIYEDNQCRYQQQQDQYLQHQQSKGSKSSSKLTLLDQNESNCITFVDLAGSERLQTLKSTPQRLKKETVFINKSLSALGDVIHCKSNNSKHIPYRNSVLTTILREDLQGSNKKVLLVAHLDGQNFKESINTLALASKVQNINNLHNLMNKRKK